VPVMPIFSSFSSRMFSSFSMQHLLSFSAIEMELSMCMSACSVDLFLEKPY
jgi:hypothetical protein